MSNNQIRNNKQLNKRLKKKMKLIIKYDKIHAFIFYFN